MAETDPLHPDNVIQGSYYQHPAAPEKYRALYEREQKAQARIEKLAARIASLQLEVDALQHNMRVNNESLIADRDKTRDELVALENRIEEEARDLDRCDMPGLARMVRRLLDKDNKEVDGEKA